LWTTKHAPNSASEIIGNTDRIKDIFEWLKDWKEVFVKKTKVFPEKSKKIFIPG
jgi:hypothetical protein